ncbi:hypothetical protein CI102_10425 [Trichoderma harzianum]|uniref:Uncharacterized protein n=1 Tax=Trichoderma harzianum CBS 226.95 TaxID=983964 RepID=A0A2T4AB31_TRIHA|nr:hypothetical protein M431DRAFT_453750 [Trichoderma harzianum CBS 226.95]PKK45604.1 hypothetical protein CI102_10425 [Trichoderma harzianum]PTB54262.1 hypothetical protein M431DRAFT_453750 [Trichoderma harzianum CBS 226.95]
MKIFWMQFHTGDVRFQAGRGTWRRFLRGDTAIRRVSEWKEPQRAVANTLTAGSALQKNRRSNSYKTREFDKSDNSKQNFFSSTSSTREIRVNKEQGTGSTRHMKPILLSQRGRGRLLSCLQGQDQDRAVSDPPSKTSRTLDPDPGNQHPRNKHPRNKQIGYPPPPSPRPELGCSKPLD